MLIGEYDKPSNQEQGLLKYSLDANILIFGSQGSGKENLLATIIYSSCVFHTPQEINYYILDFGSETLSMFNKMPHVGSFITSDKKEYVMSLFAYLEKQIQKRKDLFSEYQDNLNTLIYKLIENDRWNLVFLVDQDEIDTLKRKCYEMKLNGITRILMPITKNLEIIDSLKIIFDLHNIINNTMGNYLLYDQYMFIYDSLHFLTTTNFSEQFEILKNRDFMEECVPRYVIYNFINHSAGVLNKMRLHYKEHEGRPFKFEDSYQITQHDLMNEDNELIFAYEIYGSFKNFFNDAIKEKKKKYDEEVKKFGRFWISEGFFKKEDKPLWLEAIDLLSEINILVREDIRDYFITMKKREEEEHDNLNLSSSKNNSSFLEQNSNVSGISKTKTAKKGKKQLKPLVKKKSLNKTDTKNKRRRKSSSRKYSTNSLSEQNKLPKDLNNLRPPTVWNFPVHRIEKIYIDGNKKEIRNVDPTLCYKDGRVDKFLKLFEEIYQNTLKYFMTSSADLWDYFYSKCLKALKISYTTSKELKAEEELKRQIEEELRRQQEEEARKEEERERELERLKIKKKGEGELPQETNDENKENAVNNKEEKKTEEKKIPSAKKRLSSAKPSKEVLKKRGEIKGTSRIQSATKK